LEIVEAPDWLGLSAGIRPGCPVVVRCNGSAVYFAHILRETVRPSVRWAERLALAAADSVAAVSRFTAELTAKLFSLKTSIRVIPNGVDLNRFAPAREGETERSTVLYVGTLVRKKGVLDLCQAFSRIVERAPDAGLRMLGRDAADRHTGAPSTWALCQDTLSRRARERVEYLGPRPYGELPSQIRRAAVCVFPSYAEALPLSWLEAMACAKPIVAYGIGWASEVVENGETGFLAPAGDVDSLAERTTRILEDVSLGLQLGRAARCRVEQKFSAAQVAAASLEWYRSVIGGSRPA
jgi:glycosyltransferase involved in cell wall biosynthesis